MSIIFLIDDEDFRLSVQKVSDYLTDHYNVLKNEQLEDEHRAYCHEWELAYGKHDVELKLHRDLDSITFIGELESLVNLILEVHESLISEGVEVIIFDEEYSFQLTLKRGMKAEDVLNEM